MNPYLDKYKRTPEENAPREVESWALLISANALHDAKLNPDDQDAAMAALRANLVLWTIFEAAVTEPDNQLPHEIKENIVNLTRFVDKHTFNLFAQFNPEKLDILININRNIAAGLASNAQGAEADGNTPEGETTSQPAPQPAAPMQAVANTNDDAGARPSGGLVIDT